MAAPTENWVYDKNIITEKDYNALSRAKRLETRDIEKHGYRWYKINERNKILVPFGDDGKPTKEGLRRIENFKRVMGYK